LSLETRRLAEGVEVLVLVHPRSPREEVGGSQGGALRVRVNAPPEGGRANEAVRHALAAVLGARTAQIELVAGERSRRKRIRVQGDPETILSRLEKLEGTPEPV
jgi:uncharacterized protein (TIGR00251 family)